MLKVTSKQPMFNKILKIKLSIIKMKKKYVNKLTKITIVKKMIRGKNSWKKIKE